ncbi:MAG TPA: plastocyanin/azurin family copper-binding protein [Chloroflexota bacterium]|nr:plastocyanin/azurin family copper-binding protein [Chloroflexota bacterium]
MLKLGAILLAGLVALGVVSLALLFYADYSIAGNGSADPGQRVAWVLERGDHLHFAGHLVAGRILDLCPCSRRAAVAQYVYARFHALTPRQKAAVTNIQPRSVGELAAYATAPFAVGLDWIGDGVAWLGGTRPSKVVVVALDQYEVRPSEIHIARGTRVIWRNTDELGEAHTVTADPGTWLLQFDSGWLEPDEQFEITFTDRGQYSYFCEAHGAPGHGGMSGLVIVD